jgi:hypothetical protein
MSAPELKTAVAQKNYSLEALLATAGALKPVTEETVAGLEQFTKIFNHGSVKASMAGVKSRDLWQVDPLTVRFLEDFNTRLDTPDLEAHIEALTLSIMENGFYIDQPVTIMVIRELVDGVEVDVKYITGGHCRTKASLRAIARGAPLKTIPAVTEDRATTIEELIVKLHQSNTGKPFTPYEVGLNCKRLLRFNWDIPMIAKKMNLSVPYTTNLIMLVSSPFDIRNAVIFNKITATHAIELLHKYGPEKAVEELAAMLLRAAKEGKTRVTGKHGKGAQLKKAVTKHGNALYEAAKKITSDPQFKQLSTENQTLLQDLMNQLKAAEAADKEASGDFIDGESTEVAFIEGQSTRVDEPLLIEGQATRVDEPNQAVA